MIFDREAYERDGFQFARNAISKNVLTSLDKVAADFTDNLLGNWRDSGLIEHLYRDLPVDSRLFEAWCAAGKPKYSTNPYINFITPDLYRAVMDDQLLDMVADVLGTHEIFFHGTFNGRVKLPDQPWSETPWHQDAQYYEKWGQKNIPTAIDAPFVTVWIPLQDCLVGETGTLELASRFNYGERKLLPAVSETAIILRPDEIAEITDVTTDDVRRGDAILIDRLTPHRAQPNGRPVGRWNFDFRFTSADGPIDCGKPFGMIVRSKRNPDRVTKKDEWLSMRLTPQDLEGGYPFAKGRARAPY